MCVMLSRVSCVRILCVCPVPSARCAWSVVTAHPERRGCAGVGLLGSGSRVSVVRSPSRDSALARGGRRGVSRLGKFPRSARQAPGAGPRCSLSPSAFFSEKKRVLTVSQITHFTVYFITKASTASLHPKAVVPRDPRRNPRPTYTLSYTRRKHTRVARHGLTEVALGQSPSTPDPTNDPPRPVSLPSPPPPFPPTPQTHSLHARLARAQASCATSREPGRLGMPRGPCESRPSRRP